MLEQALERHRAGDLDAAERIYREALEANADNPELHNLLALVLADGGRLDEALESANRAVTARPDFAAAHATVANIRFRLGDPMAARASMEAALGLDPNLPQGRNTLGYLQWVTGDLAAAEASLRMALKQDPDSPQVMTNLGGVLLDKGEVNAAISHFQDALDAQPGSLAARMSLGRAFLAQGASAFAEECFRRCLEQRPDSLTAKALLGRALVAGHRHAEAATLFDQVLAAEPGNVDALVGSADVHQAAGQYAEAGLRLQQALKIRRGDLHMLDKLGEVLIQDQELDAALRLYDQLADRLSPSALARRRGRVLNALGRHEEAASALRAVLDGDPRDSEAALLLAQSLELSGDGTGARSVLESLPDDAVLIQRVKLALAALDLAEGHAEAVLGRFDGMEIGQYTPVEQASIEEMMGRALDEMGRYEEAAQYWRKIRRTIDSHPPHWRQPAVSLDQARQWQVPAEDDERPDPLLLLGVPGSGVEALVEAFSCMAGVAVLDDRLSGVRSDCLTDPATAEHLAEIDDTQVRLGRKTYWDKVRRALGSDAGQAQPIDWIPSARFDPIQVARFFPGATVLVIDRHPCDLILHSISLGWRQGLMLGVDDLEVCASALSAARRLGLQVERVGLDDLIDGQLDGLRGVLERHAIGHDDLAPCLEEAFSGSGDLKPFFPAGHWQHYSQHFRWDQDRLSQLARD